MPKFEHMHTTDLLSSAEAAAILKVDRATLNRWAAAGKVPTADKYPGKTGPRRFDPDVVDRLAAERKSAA